MSPLGVLLLAVVGISLAAPLIRLSDADPLVVAVWRLAVSLVVVAAALLATGGWRQWRGLPRRDVAIAGAAGALLAVHFWSWNASLGLTSVAASVVLVNLQPAFVILGSALWLRERPTARQAGGIGIATLGAVAVALADAGGGDARPQALLGDALALLGAVTAAGYYLIGRRLRAALDLWPYVGLVYGSCLATLLAIALVRGVPLLPQPPREWAIFAGLALGPMLLGHTGMNWALRYLPAYVVNLTVLGEPVGATLLAWALPSIREVPGAGTLVGGALVLAGAVLATARRAAPASPPAPHGAPQPASRGGPGAAAD